MGKEIKFGYVDMTPDFSKYIVNPLKRENLTNEDKFVQVKINGGEYIRAGGFYHRRLLMETLKEFGVLGYGVRKNRAGHLMPLPEGKDYKLIGAGKLSILGGEGFLFYDTSSDYMRDIHGTNRENLEKIFGKENVENSGIDCLFGPSLVVNFKNLSF